MLIDIDHYIHYLFIKKKYAGVFTAYLYFHKLAQSNKKVPVGLYIFHTMEVNILLAFVGLFIPIVRWVFLGFIFHLILDRLPSYLKGVQDSRANSYFEFNAKRERSKKARALRRMRRRIQIAPIDSEPNPI